MVAHLTPFDWRYRESVAGAAAILRTAGSSGPDAQVQAQGMIYGTMVRQANMLAFADAFWVMGVLFLSIIPLMFLIKNVRPSAGQVVVE
jgi:DHA2 family multidrug resistance protein